MLASYTIAKLIDNTNSEINWLEAASPSWGDANAYNLRGERSLDGFDVPQRLVIGSILDLPVGRGKAFGSNMSDVTDKVIGGWGINTIITFQSGYPDYRRWLPGSAQQLGHSESRLCAADENSLFAPDCRFKKPEDSAEWYDTSVFTAGDPTYYGYGTDSRTEPNIRGDGSKTSTLPPSRTRSLVRMAIRLRVPRRVLQPVQPNAV